MKFKINFRKCMLLAFSFVAISIIIYVIFSYPQAGVADQGDFDRVMSVSRLRVMDKDIQDHSFKRFFDYIVTDYKILSMQPFKLREIIFSTSIAYLIIIINSLCSIFGQYVFKTSYLAAVYGIIYLFSLYMIIKYLDIQDKLKLLFIIPITLLVFFDGNYLVWFNSLYGEPMMITTLMLFISSCLYYLYHLHVLNSKKNTFIRIIFIYISAWLFIGSKMQVITALPFIMFMLVKVLLESKKNLKPSLFILLCAFLYFIVKYPIQLKELNKPISKDTQYNSVFYGVLNGSKNPRQDLIDMGLNPDMAVEAGKHSYLAKSEYLKYIPRTEITEKEFYSKMNNKKLVKFYLTHPDRFFEGMEYTAAHGFATGTSLGKYKRSYSEEPVREFHRFTLWSDFRERVFPKKLWFIVCIYMLVILISAIYYVKNREYKDIRDKIELFWVIITIGIVQFPMPYVGNGQADTAKQLFLFNFIFDLMLVTSVCWGFCKGINKFNKMINFKIKL